jgi:hypothetical protein
MCGGDSVVMLWSYRGGEEMEGEERKYGRKRRRK